MSRSSLRMKQYRPMSADFTKVNSSLSSVFGLNSETSNDKNGSSNNGGVLLINYKKSDSDCDDLNVSSSNSPAKNAGRIPSPISENSPKPPTGLAPIAQDEDLDSNCNESFDESDLVNSAEVQNRLNNNKNHHKNHKNEGRRSSVPTADPQNILDTAKLLIKEKSRSGCALNRKLSTEAAGNNSPGGGNYPSLKLDVEDEEEDSFWGSDLEEELLNEEEDNAKFESFSEDEDLTANSKTSCGNKKKDGNPEIVTNPQQQEENSKLSNFMKSRSLRDKLRDSKTWTISRRSAEKEITSPNANNNQSQNSSVNQSPNHNDTSSTTSNTSNSEGRLSRLFSLRRSIGPGSNIFDLSNSPTSSSNNLNDSNSQRSSMATMPRLAEEEEQMLGGSAPPLKRGGAPPTPSLPLLTPALMSSLTPEQMKRRHIISSLVHSENNYVATLQRLINDYKKPLEDSNPPILSSSKVKILFHRLPEILQCHLLFRIALSEAIKNWDSDEKIGDVFVASFSKAVVLEIYSDFINNFSLAMECAKQESKRKSALADFLKVKQITAHDRVSFFGLMVKPVQRFPQFILLLQDLLKETPPGHADRMALQLALTTLESLAEMLNERKREAEQYAAFRDKMRNISGKLGAKSDGGNGSRFLLKEDDVTQLEFNTFGHISRSKQRRLLLLNDLLLCVTVNGRSSEVEFNAPNAANERLSLKWAVPVRDVELIDGAAGGTLARLLAPSCSSSSSTASSAVGTLSAMGKRASLGRASNPSSSDLNNINSVTGQAENLAQDMADLMYDFDVVSRIASLIGTMRTSYDGLSTEVTSHIMGEIQRSIRQKDEEMSFMDACCLQLAVKPSGNKAKDKIENYTFQTRDPSVKKEWIVELRLAQLALDPNNSPGWDVLEQERSISTKMPLYVKSFTVFHENFQTEVNCGCSYSLMVSTPTRTLRKQTYVWTNATRSNSAVSNSNLADICNSSWLRIFSVTNHHTGLKELGTIELKDLQVKAIQYVPGLNNGIAVSGVHEDALKSDLVWVGTDSQKVIIYSASDPERGLEVGRLNLSSHVVSMQYHCDAVWIGLTSGSLSVVRRDPTNGHWDLNAMQTILLGSEPVSCLLPITSGLYAACGKRVWVIDALNNEQVKSFLVQPRTDGGDSANQSSNLGAVHQMAQSGVGLWVALKNSSTICLYHTETFRHLQDINIASNVSRVLAARDVTQPQRSIYVTALMASRGLLWVGTNVGIALTVPLPRLEGVPIISGRANISYHAHFGPVTFFLNLQHKVVTDIPCITQTVTPNQYFASPAPSIREESEQDLKLSDSGCSSLLLTSSNESPNHLSPEKTALKKQVSDGSIRHDSESSESEAPPKLRYRNSSPLMVRRRVAKVDQHTVATRRTSKTLPRGFSLANQSNDMSSLDCDVYGLYGELLNVRDYDCDSGELNRQGDDLRKSDPELSTIPYRVSTLDRRVRMKTSRPRSLDMSSWSVESRGSAQTTSSSEAGSERPSPNVSRNASFQSTGTASVSSLTHQSSLQTPATPSSPAKSTSVTNHERTNNDKPSTTSNGSHSSSRKKGETQRTVTTLMGGRGYINWRRATVETKRTSALAQINNSDAFLVIWEMKL